MESSKAALVEAYLEDRYGLDDPVLMQYLRWLGRISPIKTGERDQVKPTGELVRPPKALKPPPLADSWFRDARLPEGRVAEIEATKGPAAAGTGIGREGESPEVIEYKAAAKNYAKARADYLVSKKNLDKALVRYAEKSGIEGAIKDGKPQLKVFAALPPDTKAPNWNLVRNAGLVVLEAYETAVACRAREIAAFRDGPYPKDGVPIVPGVLSLAMPDLGVAFSRGRPVKDLILDALPVTLLLNFVRAAVHLSHRDSRRHAGRPVSRVVVRHEQRGALRRVLVDSDRLGRCARDRVPRGQSVSGVVPRRRTSRQHRG